MDIHLQITEWILRVKVLVVKLVQVHLAQLMQRFKQIQGQLGVAFGRVKGFRLGLREVNDCMGHYGYREVVLVHERLSQFQVGRYRHCESVSHGNNLMDLSLQLNLPIDTLENFMGDHAWILIGQLTENVNHFECLFGIINYED